jgi:2-desacetyl-2-hydroxyethyl bacteriochlorophyllide A dehydrogenase
MSAGVPRLKPKGTCMAIESRKIVFPSPRRVRIERAPTPQIEGNTVLVESEYSLISNGTERTIFGKGFSKDSHWNQWVRYPFCPGYAITGKVIACGSNVTKPKIGDRVAIRSPHASHSCVEDHKCITIPDNVPSEDAVWFALAKIAFWGLLVAERKKADSILIVGGGPVAQLSVRWAALSAAGSVAMLANDSVQLRAALHGGAAITLNGHTGDYTVDQIQTSLGRRPEIIVDCTADVTVLPWALRVVADYGRVVLVGDPGAPNERRLTSDILLRGISIVGTHDHNTYGQWNSQTVSCHFFTMLKANAISVRDICTHDLSPELADQAYTLISEKRSGVIGVRFNWAKGV